MWVAWAGLLCLLGVGCASEEVTQTRSLMVEEGQPAQLLCTPIKGHDAMYWYRQDKGQGPQLLFYFRNNEQIGKTPEGFSAVWPKTGSYTLNILSVKQEDAAVYLCASSLSSYSELHFGKGTRLTVLEKGQVSRPPNVTIFAPSKEELKEKQMVTLVCLAYNFYPDHVSINWYSYGEEITEGVKTEELSKHDNTMKSYSLTSRLRISKEQWMKAMLPFQCSVTFGVEPPKVYESAVYGKDCATESVTYQKSGSVGKYIYLLLICKSTVYGFFVMGLMLRKKKVQ